MKIDNKKITEFSPQVNDNQSYLVDNKQNWEPSANIDSLIKKAKTIQQIRNFFQQKNVLEVQTPILSSFPITDLHLENLKTEFNHGSINKTFYLQTSPEYHMKRLICAGSGSIFQILPVFRNDELGRIHNPEFLMLEWYRINFSMFELIDEIDELLRLVLGCKKCEKYSYNQLFAQFVGIDLLSASLNELCQKAKSSGFQNPEQLEFNDLAQFLFSYYVEPNIGLDAPAVVYNFPKSQASLAKICPKDPRVAQRFEVYYKGLELANGFCELNDYQEQYQRFLQDNQLRQQYNKENKEIDMNLIAALKAGMPNCSGVALGLDRLIMLKLDKKNISEVMAFSFDRA